MKLPTTWKMCNGCVIKIVDMDDSHLTNTLLMMKRNVTKICRREADILFREDLSALASALSQAGGDDAQMTIEGEMARLEVKDIDVGLSLSKMPRYVALCQEAEFRSDLREFEAANKRRAT